MITPSRFGSLHVDVSVELDAREHGIEIASNENSNEQARLIAGLGRGFEGLGALNGMMQITYLAESIRQLPEEDRAVAEWWMRYLVEALDEFAATRTSSGSLPGGDRG